MCDTQYCLALGQNQHPQSLASLGRPSVADELLVRSLPPEVVLAVTRVVVANAQSGPGQRWLGSPPRRPPEAPRL